MKAVLSLIFVAALFGAVLAQTDGKKRGKKDFCDKKDPGAVLEKMDDCIKDPILETWLECREETVGTEDPEEGAEVYCSKDDKEKRKIRKQYTKCLKDNEVSWGMIKTEVEDNCGVCSDKHKDILVKLDKCMEDGDVKDATLKCREEVLGTQDPIDALTKYCSSDRKMRKKMAIMKEGVTHENWKESTKHCKKEE